MESDPLPLAYATPEPLVVSWERARRVFAWFSLGYAAVNLLSGVVAVVSLRQIGLTRWPQLIAPVASPARE